jgi:hypothetical protein
LRVEGFEFATVSRAVGNSELLPMSAFSRGCWRSVSPLTS